MISPGLGSALSGFFTATGAMGAIFLAQYFFRGRITDLKSAVRETEETVERYQHVVNEKLEAISGAIESLNQVIGGVQESVAKTQAAVHDSQPEEEQSAAQAIQAPAKERLTNEWYGILDHIESIASSPNVDGRKRAKYGRIDRRSYYDLIDSLDADGLLGGARDAARAATELWYSCRRRPDATEEDVNAMQGYRRAIAAIPMP
jgi:hypothetical protein